jgi:hypothetical protein
MLLDTAKRWLCLFALYFPHHHESYNYVSSTETVSPRPQVSLLLNPTASHLPLDVRVSIGLVEGREPLPLVEQEVLSREHDVTSL